HTRDPFAVLCLKYSFVMALVRWKTSKVATDYVQQTKQKKTIELAEIERIEVLLHFSIHLTVFSYNVIPTISIYWRCRFGIRQDERKHSVNETDTHTKSLFSKEEWKEINVSEIGNRLELEESLKELLKKYTVNDVEK
ncbi:5231_t:CDS:2, partial [Acaulospora morrowiae]